MSKPAFELVNVARYFEDGQVHAIDGVTFSVEAGTGLAVVGPSGSGKSTLLNIIGTLDFPSSGELRLFGESIDRKSSLDQIRRHRIGFVFQLHTLIPSLTLCENVIVPMIPLGIDPVECRKQAEHLLRRVGLEERMDFFPAKVSSGERQRTAIARALINNPDIILADEPTGSLDSENGRRVIELLEELTLAADKTLVLVTHNQALASRLSRVLVLKDGRIAAD